MAYSKGVLKQTLDQSGTVLGKVLDDNIPPTIPEKPVQRRFLFVLRYRVANFDDTAIATVQELNLVATGVLEEEPKQCTNGSVYLSSSPQCAVGQITESH